MTCAVMTCEKQPQFSVRVRYGDGSGLDANVCDEHLKTLRVTMWDNIKYLRVIPMEENWTRTKK